MRSKTQQRKDLAAAAARRRSAVAKVCAPLKEWRSPIAAAASFMIVFARASLIWQHLVHSHTPTDARATVRPCRPLARSMAATRGKAARSRHLPSTAIMMRCERRRQHAAIIKIDTSRILPAFDGPRNRASAPFTFANWPRRAALAPASKQSAVKLFCSAARSRFQSGAARSCLRWRTR